MANEELVYKGKVVIEDPELLFEEYEVSDEDLTHYRNLIARGKQEQAIDEFSKKYHVPITELYTEEIQSYLEEAAKGEMSKENNMLLTSAVIASTLAFQNQYINNFINFVTKSYAPVIFSDNGIRSPAVKQAVLDETIAQFSTLTQGALAQTEMNVLTQIRSIQKQFIVENQYIQEMNFVGVKLEDEITRFNQTLKDILPEYYRMMEEGYIIKDKIGRAWTLEDYSDMSMRNTILNVDRTSVEVSQRIDGAKVVEYYLRDDREVKSEREICQEILSNTIDGMALLALDEDTADKLGIMTLEDARAQGAMGINCRHSIMPVDGGGEDLISSEESSGEESA